MAKFREEIQQSGIQGDNRQHYQRFLEQWPWEWAVTLRIGKRDHAGMLRHFRTEILRKEGGQLASMGIFVDEANGHNGRHVHLLMLGRFPGGRTLKDIDKAEYETLYGTMTRSGSKGAVIGKVDDLAGATSYIVRPRNTPPGRHELLVPWGRILNRTKLVHSSLAHISS
jgi:hypothetical protein